MTTLRYLTSLYLKLKSLWKPYGYFGNYSSWEEAVQSAGGYDDLSIFNKVKEASAAVRDGKANFERDGLTFSEPFQWEALKWIEKLAAGKRKLRIIDFGGALGSHYYPVKQALSEIQFEWIVIEQEGFVSIGNNEFADGMLSFSSDLNAELKKGADLVLFGCVLPYLPEPYTVLDTVMKAKVPSILIDKHPLISSDSDRLTVQRIPPSIYTASYPAWFFGQRKFEAFMSDYKLVDSYWCPDIFNINSRFKTYFYQLKEKDGFSHT